MTVVWYARISLTVQDLWNQKQRSYANLPARYVLMVRYEDMVTDPGGVVRAINERYNVPIKHDFVNIMTSTKENVRKDFEFYKTYYTEERWRARYDHLPTLNFISALLDDEVLDAWRYDKWNPDPRTFVHTDGSWMVKLPPGSRLRNQQEW